MSKHHHYELCGKCPACEEVFAKAQAWREWPKNIDWQSIESAPKDGEPLLLYIPNLVFSGVEIGFYDDYGDGRFWRTGDSMIGWRLNGNQAWEGQPTHWMPLPNPPTN